MSLHVFPISSEIQMIPLLPDIYKDSSFFELSFLCLDHTSGNWAVRFGVMWVSYIAIKCCKHFISTINYI